MLKILFVEDLTSDVELAVMELRKEKLIFEYTTVCTRVDLDKTLKEFKPDLIISDYLMPAFNGLQALKAVKEFNPEIPFILFTGSVNEETAVECIKAGAVDYVIKEHMTRLPFAVKEALEQISIRKEKRASDLLLKDSEEKLQSIFSNAPVGIGLVVNKVVLEVNDAFCNITGYKRNELIGKSSETLYPSMEEFEFDRREYSHQIKEKGNGSIETTFKCKGGKIINIILSVAPLDINDSSKGITFTLLDITERKLSEEALKESQHLFQTLSQVSPVGIFRTNPDGYTTYVNPKWQELSGLTSEESMGFGWLKAVHPDDREQLNERWNSDVQTQQNSFAEYRFLRSDGSIVWVMGNAVPEWIGNEIAGYIGTITDITERKLVEQTLNHAKEKAEASNRLKTEFLNNISHEVRTPLNGILGFAEIISQQDLSEVERRNSLAILVESSDRLLNTITNYMDISLITSGSMTVNKKDFIPARVLRKIFNNYESVCLNRKLELFLEVPEQFEDLFINSDLEIFQKILSHFLDNAVKFTEKGSIHFGFKSRDELLEFFVKDTGIGIRKESFINIFDRFAKEDQGPYKISEGSGLGLSIAKGMSEIIGGKIRLESKPGIGSCFFLTIPIMKSAEVSMSGIPGKDQKKGIAGSLILVAEDDETNFYYLKALLTRETGAVILHASNGREAIELFKANPGIKLILMDIKMPEIDGFEATRQIKLVNRNVVVIAITAYAMSGDEDKIISAGCDGYLSKPINKKSLLEKMAEFINIR